MAKKKSTTTGLTSWKALCLIEHLLRSLKVKPFKVSADIYSVIEGSSQAEFEDYQTTVERYYHVCFERWDEKNKKCSLTMRIQRVVMYHAPGDISEFIDGDWLDGHTRLLLTGDYEDNPTLNKMRRLALKVLGERDHDMDQVFEPPWPKKSTTKATEEGAAASSVS